MRTIQAVMLLCAASLCCAPDSDEECPRPGYDAVSYADTLDQWAGAEVREGERRYCDSVAEGVCADGKRFLALGASGPSYTREVRYFDTAGEFVGGAFAGDYLIGNCAGHAGPSRRAVRCKDPVGAPLCGEAEAGPIQLPYAD
ncbi:MAG: hypothetical protein RL033_4864 [Pseudomonadota bacterium]|jgi:hypothetical protein